VKRQQEVASYSAELPKIVSLAVIQKLQTKTCTNSASVSAAEGRTSSVAEQHCWMIIREEGTATFAATDASVSIDMFSFVYL